MKHKDNVQEFLDLAIDFVASFRQIKSAYELYNKLLGETDKATQDILHKFELDKINSKEKAVWATKLSNIRKDRRYYKDKVEALKSMLDVIEGIDNNGGGFIKSINQLGNTAGNVRRKYLNNPNRTYKPKVITDLIINSQIQQGEQTNGTINNEK